MMLYGLRRYAVSLRVFWGADVCVGQSLSVLSQSQGNKIRGAQSLFFSIWNILVCNAQTGLGKGPYMPYTKECQKICREP